MAKELQHPQVSETQLELWLANPVTRTFMQVLAWKAEKVAEDAGTGKLTDSSNADLTHALLHRAFGQQDALRWAQSPEAMLEADGMIDHPPKPDEDGNAQDR